MRVANNLDLIVLFVLTLCAAWLWATDDGGWLAKVDLSLVVGAISVGVTRVGERIDEAIENERLDRGQPPEQKDDTDQR